MRTMPPNAQCAASSLEMKWKAQMKAGHKVPCLHSYAHTQSSTHTAKQTKTLIQTVHHTPAVTVYNSF